MPRRDCLATCIAIHKLKHGSNIIGCWISIWSVHLVFLEEQLHTSAAIWTCNKLAFSHGIICVYYMWYCMLNSIVTVSYWGLGYLGRRTLSMCPLDQPLTDQGVCMMLWLAGWVFSLSLAVHHVAICGLVATLFARAASAVTVKPGRENIAQDSILIFWKILTRLADRCHGFVMPSSSAWCLPHQCWPDVYVVSY